MRASAQVCFFIALAWALLAAWLFGSHLLNADLNVHRVLEKERVVAKWQYCRASRNGDEVGLAEGNPDHPTAVVPGLVGTDQSGRIYIADLGYLAGERQWGALRVFNSSGKQVVALTVNNPSRFGTGVFPMAATAGGYVWVGGRGGEFIIDRPAVDAFVYSGRNNTTVGDLCGKLPKGLATFLGSALGEGWYNDDRPVEGSRGPARVERLFANGNRVVLFLDHERLDRKLPSGGQVVDRMLRIELTENARDFLKGQVVDYDRERFIDAAGREWISQLVGHRDKDGLFLDWRRSPWEWQAHPVDQPDKATSLISSQMLYKIAERIPNDFTVLGADFKGRFYLVFDCEAKSGGSSREGKESEAVRDWHYVRKDGSQVKLQGTHQLVLLVVNSMGQPVHQNISPPQSSPLDMESWVQFLPDGGGYYELRLLQREAQIVFHPLP